MTRRTRVTGGRAAAAAGAGLALALIANAGAAASDTLPWTGDSAKGPNQPYQHGYTPTQLLAWDPATDPHADMLRARIPLQPRADADASTQRDPELPAATQLLTLAGDYGNAFFDSYPYTNEFSQYLFSYWQYTDVYAPWHGMASAGVPEDLYDPSAEWTQRWFEFGAMNLPNPGYTDAAHRNGVRSLGTIFFSDNDRGSQDYRELLVRDADGSFPAAAKLAEIAEYFGFDGWFINQEQSRVAADDVDDYQDFLAQLRRAGQYVQWYDAVDAGTGDKLYENEFTPRNSPFVRDATGRDLADSIFLNYWWDHDMLAASADHARSLGLDPLQSVFAGLEAGQDQFDQEYDLRDVLDGNGDPMTSIATLGADFVHADYPDKLDDASQWETFDRERRWWTGSATGGADDRPDDDDWQGISRFIAERTPIEGTTFATTFNTGHGLGYWHRGERVSGDEWGNIGVQDVPVTWQWWWDAGDETSLQVDYDFGPGYTPAGRFDYERVGGYTGGSSLVIAGDVSGDATLRLFKSSLDVRAGSAIELTYRKAASDGAALTVDAVFASDPSTVVELPVSGSRQGSDGWRTATLDLGEYAGETITTLGVGLHSAGPTTTQVNLGALTVSDGHHRTPHRPTGLSIDRVLSATDELTLSWDLDDFDEVSRYDAYVDGRYIGGVYDDVLYAKNVELDGRSTVSLVAVGQDGSESRPAEVRYDTRRGLGDVAVTTEADGAVTVSWSEPARARTVVTLDVDSDEPGRWRDAIALAPARGATSVTFDDAPTDGSALVATVATRGGTPVAATGTAADTEIEGYPADAASLDGVDLRLTRPGLADWHTLTILEDGEPVGFDTTYSQGPRSEMIRGRTTLDALNVTLRRPDSRVVAVIEDYAGNTAETVLRAG